MELDQLPVHRVSVKSSTENLNLSRYNYFQLTNTNHMYIPLFNTHVSSLQTASQKGSYSMSPEISAHGNCA